MRLLTFLAAMALPTAVHAAEWREAETAHFRIMSAGEEKDLLKFAERLEHFHTLLRLATGASEEGLRILKVRVVLVPSVTEVARLYGADDKGVLGFYSPREEGPIAVVPASTDGFNMSGQQVLFHEYAHHYMLQYSPVAYPAWYVEGFAEITSTASFDRPGTISYGKAAVHRKDDLETRRYPTAKMVDGSYIKEGDGRPWSYGDAWLVTHYLTFADKRRGQLRAYLDAMNSGQPMEQAAKVFGDLNELQREVSIYFAGRSFPYRAVPLPPGSAGEIKLRQVPTHEASLIETQIELGRRLRLPNKADEAAEQQNGKAKPPEKDYATRLAAAKAERDQWLAQLEAQVASSPGSVHGWRLLADARCGAEQHEACLAAADRALAVAPGDPRAQVRKAQAMMALARELPAEQRKARVTEARTMAAKVMNANPDDPVSRFVFYRSYAAEGRKASPVGVKALVEAVHLVPKLDGPRLILASELASLGQIEEGRAVLRPLAFDPHGGGAAAAARGMLAKLDAMGPTPPTQP